MPRRPNRPFSHLLPTLIDRLADSAPGQKDELPSDYAVTQKGMRDILQRDLAYLLNTVNHGSNLDRPEHLHAASSVINYGVPAMAGGYLAQGKWGDVEKAIRRAVLDFEPRLLPHTLQVLPLAQKDSHHYNVLAFEIRGLIHMNPYPMEFMVQSSLDLETHRVHVSARP